MLRDDEKCVRVVASDVPDDVGVLVKLLECPDAHRGDLVVGGVIAPVVRGLDAGACSATAKERAARVLCSLTKNSDNAWVVAARRGVTELLNVCTDHGGVLRSLAGVDEIWKYMVADAGAVPALVSLSQGASATSGASSSAASGLAIGETIGMMRGAAWSRSDWLLRSEPGITQGIRVARFLFA